jgi:hypothetical protein
MESMKLMADDIMHVANGSESELGKRTMEIFVVVGGVDDLREALKKLGAVDVNYVKPLFVTRKLAWSTALLNVLLGQSFRHMGYITYSHFCTVDPSSVSFVILSFFQLSGNDILIGLLQVQLVCHLLVSLSFAICISVFIFTCLPLGLLLEEPISG